MAERPQWHSEAHDIAGQKAGGNSSDTDTGGGVPGIGAVFLPLAIEPLLFLLELQLDNTAALARLAHFLLEE